MSGFPYPTNPREALIDRSVYAAMVEHIPPPGKQPPGRRNGRRPRVTREQAEAAAVIARETSVRRAAEDLGVHPRTLQKVWQKFNIDGPGKGPPPAAQDPVTDAMPK
jgi:transcriptional regulator GlxA family with amidase domain